MRYGRYILIDRLGAGGMAEVFRALAIGAEQFQSLMVVKRILPHLCSNEAFVKMFIDEAKLCGQLSHPNIIRVHDFGKQEGQYFIAMEYVQGRNLGPIIRRLAERRELMPFAIAADIIRQACRGLAYAHGLTAGDGKPLGIIHRDISPGNVMVSYAGAVKVLDFGVARVENRFRKALTDPGQVKGKAAYLAPEQIASPGFDHRADIFPMGILLHEMLTGRRLFRGVSATDSMTLIKTMPISPPSQVNPLVPAALDAIVLRALARDPDRRYQSAADMANDLEALLLEARFPSHELPRFMQTFFENDSHSDRLDLTREDLQELIRRAEKTGAHAAVTSTTPPASPSVAPAPAAAGPAPAPRVGPSPEDQATLSLLDQWPEPEPEMEEPAPPPRRRAFALAGVGLAASLALGLTIASRRSSSAARAPVPAPAASAVVAPPTLPALVPSAAAAAAAEIPRPPAPQPPGRGVVTISITTQPAGATVYEAEGAAVLGITPLEVTHARGDQPLGFRIAKAGYVEGLLKIVPDADKPALVTLATSAAVRPSRHDKRDKPDRPDKKVRNALPMDPFSK